MANPTGAAGAAPRVPNRGRAPASGGAPRVEWIDDPERFAELGAAWGDAAGEAAPPHLRHSWFATWWSCFGTGRRLATCALWEGERLAACLPAGRRAGGLEAMANHHTPLFAPLVARPELNATLAEAALARARRTLSVPCLAADAPFAAALERAAALRGGPALRERFQRSPIVETDGDLEGWRRSTRPKWLARIARYRRQMARRHALELSVAQPPVDLARELDAGFELEARGWKGREGSAIASSPRTERFYRSVAATLSDTGELRLSSLRLDGRLAAFDLAFEHDRRLYSLKTAFDEELRKLVPGLVLRLSIVESCFERGLEAHELLGDEMDWKLGFATTARDCQTVSAFSRSPAGRAESGYRRRVRPALARWARRRGLRPVVVAARRWLR